MIRQLVIPSELGDGIEVRLLSWCRADGDAFAAGDALLEFETDKAIVLVSSTQAAVMRRTFYVAGDWMKPGDVAAWISDAPNDPLPERTEPAQSILLTFEIT